jgi:hypothetical protein
MRFLPHEHAAVTEALAARGIDIRTVLFVKRRGRLHVQIPGRTDTFAFFRKKTTRLDANGQWLDRTDYYLGNAKTDGAGIGWEDVLTAFRAWLGA